MALFEEVVRLNFDTKKAKESLGDVSKEVGKVGDVVKDKISGSVANFLGKSNPLLAVAKTVAGIAEGAATGAASGIAATSGLESQATANFRAGRGARDGLIDSTVGQLPIVGKLAAEQLKFEFRKDEAAGIKAEDIALQRAGQRVAQLQGAGIEVSDASIRGYLDAARARSLRETVAIKRVNDQADYQGSITNAQRLYANYR